MSVLQVMIGVGAVVFFVYLVLMPSERRSKKPATGEDGAPETGGDAWTARQGGNAHNSAQMGAGTGLMGGDIEDASIARYALSRTKKDPKSSDERDLGTALGMQNGTNFGE